MTRLLAITSLLALGAACADLPVGGFGNTMGPEMGRGNLDGTMSGSMDRVRDFDGALAGSMGYSYGDWTSLNLNVDTPQGWAMMGIELPGTLGEGDLADGAVLFFENGSLVRSGLSNGEEGDQPDGGLVDGDAEGEGWAFGCSGPDFGMADYDEPVEEARIEVDVDPITGDITLDIEASFGADGDAGTTTSSVSFPGGVEAI